MANISISSTKVKSTLASITTIYESIESTLEEMENKKEELSQFWTSKEATTFSTKLSELSNHVKSFNDKYNSFIAFINDVLDTYGSCNTDLVSTINSITAKAQSDESSNE